MDVWVRKLGSFEEEREADREYWARITPQRRVEILEEMRQEWWAQHGDGGEPRIHRVVRKIDVRVAAR